MSEVFAAALGAFAVLVIPLVAWFSRRATREGRLLLRIERLGAVYALMPASPERKAFETYLNASIGDLNAWLNADNAKRRRIIRLISGCAYVIGVVFVLAVIPYLDADADPWQTGALGSIVGFAIAAVSLLASLVMERSARTKSAAEAIAREEAAAAIRIEALRQGEPFPTVPTVKRPN